MWKPCSKYVWWTMIFLLAASAPSSCKWERKDGRPCGGLLNGGGGGEAWRKSERKGLARSTAAIPVRTLCPAQSWDQKALPWDVGGYWREHFQALSHSFTELISGFVIELGLWILFVSLSLLHPFCIQSYLRSHHLRVKKMQHKDKDLGGLWWLILSWITPLSFALIILLSFWVAQCQPSEHTAPFLPKIRSIAQATRTEEWSEKQ